jgi:hypothetical protein
MPVRNASGAAILSTADGKSECSNRSENSDSAAGRVASASCLGARHSGMPFGVAFTAFAARFAVCITFDRNLELGLEVFHALVERIFDFDILTIAEKRAFGLATRRLATALKVGLALDEATGLAIDLAIHIGFGIARSRTTRLALGFAICRGRSGFALGIAFTVARGLAGVFAASVRGARAGSVAGRAAVTTATRSAFELTRVDLAFGFAGCLAIGGATGLHRGRTHSVATDVKISGALRREIDRLA